MYILSSFTDATLSEMGRNWDTIYLPPPPSYLLPILLLFCPFACFNLIGKPVARCQADKCTETLLTFNLFMDRCKYCCQWYQSLVQQSPRKLLIHFPILCSLQSVTENCDPEYSFLTKTIELNRAQLQKIAFIFKQCYTHADTLLMILLPWRKYIAPARILSFGALSHTSDDKIPTERDFFLILQVIVCTLDNSPFCPHLG